MAGKSLAAFTSRGPTITMGNQTYQGVPPPNTPYYSWSDGRGNGAIYDQSSGIANRKARLQEFLAKQAQFQADADKVNAQREADEQREAERNNAASAAAAMMQQQPQQQLMRPQSMGGGGGGRGGFGGFGGMPQPQQRINARAKIAETGDDIIKRQGGLSPSYGPSGINDTYSKSGIGAFNALQNSRKRAQAGDVQGANMFDKANQYRGNGDEALAQQGFNAIKDRDVIGKSGTPAVKPTMPPVPGIQPMEKPDTSWMNMDTFNGGSSSPAMDTSAYDNASPDQNDGFDEYGNPIPMYAKGGKVNGTAIMGEVGPETKFNQDGSIEQINQPMLVTKGKPGIVVPNGKLQQFLQKFNRPPKDAAIVDGMDANAYADGGTYDGAGDPVGGPTWEGNAPVPMPNMNDPLNQDRMRMMKMRQLNISAGYPIPAYADGGAYGKDKPLLADTIQNQYNEENPQMPEIRYDANGEPWMADINNPGHGIKMPNPALNQFVNRRNVHSWEEPLRGPDTMSQAIVNRAQRQQANEAYRPTANDQGGVNIINKYGTGSSTATGANNGNATFTGFGGKKMDANEFFQRAANRLGENNQFAKVEDGFQPKKQVFTGAGYKQKYANDISRYLDSLRRGA